LDEELEGLVGFEAVRKVQQMDWRRYVGVGGEVDAELPQCGVIQSKNGGNRRGDSVALSWSVPRGAVMMQAARFQLDRGSATIKAQQ
jgi:hypothetical protein